MSTTATFFAELGEIVGPDRLYTDAATQDRFARSTAPDGTRPIGVVKPVSRDEVCSIVRLASRYSVPVFPISRGKNWGYGDACAPRDGNLIIDLSLMNHIREVNQVLAYAVIEPGVTQGQLVEFLDKNALPLMIDVTGAGPEASIVGNVLERGSGHTPYGDHFATSCNYEVVLADGSMIETGFGSYANSRAQHVYKWGVGPSLDGLFTQSNLGIVTRMTVWLMPKPENFVMFITTLKDSSAVGPFFEAIRRLRLAGTLRSTLHCFNDRRLLSSVMRFPWDSATGTQALEVERPDLFRRLCKQHGIPAWGATGSLQGTSAEVAAARRTIRQAFSAVHGIQRVIFLDERAFAWTQRVARWFRPLLGGSLLVRQLENVRVGRDMLRGRPSNETLKGSHWRAKIAPNGGADPLDTGSGLAWISPILPMTASAIEEVASFSEGIFHTYGFEYQATLTAITDRAVIAVQSLSFDHSNVDETTRARQCETDLVKQLLRCGYVPYRGPFSIMQHVWASAPSYWRTVSLLKRSWDPKGTLAPARYIAAD